MKIHRLLSPLFLVCVAALSAAASDAASQALTLYQSIQKQNWRALYYLAAYSPTIKKQLGSPDKFASDVKKGFEGSGDAATVKAFFNGMKNIRVGKATVNGSHATVPTSVDVTFRGKTSHFVGLARMVKDAGVWKWDLSTTDDLEHATSVAIQELIGKPVQK